MGGEKKNIVWIASYPKSGNTWFRAVLSNLESDQNEPVNINEFISSPIASSRIHFDESLGVSSSDMTFEEIDELRADSYRVAAETSKKLLYRKVHDAWKLSPSGKELFPEEITRAVIYIVRNPLDVAVSFSYHSNKSFADIIKQMNDPGMGLCKMPNKLYNQLRQELGNWSMHVRSWTELSGLPVYVLRYEDLLQNPLKYFSEAFQFMGLKPELEKLSTAIENAKFESLSQNESEEGFKEKPIRMDKFFRYGNSGEGKEKLSQQEIKDLTDVHFEVMKKYGYTS